MAQVQGDPTKHCCTGYWVSDQMCEGRVYDCRSGQNIKPALSERKSRYTGDSEPVVRPSSIFKDNRYYIGIGVGLLSMYAYLHYIKK